MTDARGSRPLRAGGDRRDLRAAGSYSRDHHSASSAKPQGPRHGRMAGDVWTKAARASQHMLRVPRAWALDLADLDAAERLGAAVVHIKDLEQLLDYWATPATIRRRGFALTRGHGDQVALGLEHWRPTREAAQAVAEKAGREPVGAVQLGLFEGVRP